MTRAGLSPGRTLAPGSLYGVYADLAASKLRRCTLADESHHPGSLALWVLILSVPTVALSLVLRARRRKRGDGWTTAAKDQPVVVASPRNQLERIKSVDPDFSPVLLEDFLYALYAEAHTARGRGALEPLSSYLAPGPRQALAALGASPVSTVVVGAMNIVEVEGVSPFRPGRDIQLTVEYEANYTERPAGGAEQSFYSAERWRLARSASATSRPPDRARVFYCPCCKAPLDKTIGGTCGYCGSAAGSGKYDWVVRGIEIVAREPRPPMLTGTTEERGTDLPTVRDSRVSPRLAELAAKDPAFTQEALFARVRLVFDTMQAAWSSLEWERARPYLTDALFEAQSYWITAYRAQGLRNITERAAIRRVELARVASDRYFDSVTVRLYASGLDYTVRDKDGAVVGGSKSRARPYSEYWTLVRSAARRGAPRAEPGCPSCGAPYDAGAAAVCAHCGAKVNSGEFDWVLSRIEQDEVYSG